MPPKTEDSRRDREDDRSDERLDRDAPRALKRDDERQEDRKDDRKDDRRAERRDAEERLDPVEDQHEQTAADKLAAEIEPKTDAVGAVETLVKNVVEEMRTAPDAHEMGEHFTGEARRLAEAALAGTGGLGAGAAAPTAGFNPAEIANGDQPPHNAAAVEAAVRHGVDRDQAHAMTTHGSNA